MMHKKVAETTKLVPLCSATFAYDPGSAEIIHIGDIVVPDKAELDGFKDVF